MLATKARHESVRPSSISRTPRQGLLISTILFTIGPAVVTELATGPAFAKAPAKPRILLFLAEKSPRDPWAKRYLGAAHDAIRNPRRVLGDQR